MEKRDLAFGKANYVLLAIGMVVVVIGFLLMRLARTLSSPQQ